MKDSAKHSSLMSQRALACWWTSTRGLYVTIHWFSSTLVVVLVGVF